MLVLFHCTAAQASHRLPLVSRIAKDADTSLYTVSIKDDAAAAAAVRRHEVLTRAEL